MKSQLACNYQQAQERGIQAMRKEKQKLHEQQQKLQRIVFHRNKALKEAYDRAAHIIRRYRALHEGTAEQMKFPPTSIPHEEKDFHWAFGAAVIRTFVPHGIDATQAAQHHLQSLEDEKEFKKMIQAKHKQHTQQRYEQAQLHLRAEKVTPFSSIER
jgi:hypothetical protein